MARSSTILNVHKHCHCEYLQNNLWRSTCSPGSCAYVSPLLIQGLFMNNLFIIYDRLKEADIRLFSWRWWPRWGIHQSPEVQQYSTPTLASFHNLSPPKLVLSKNSRDQHTNTSISKKEMTLVNYCHYNWHSFLHNWEKVPHWLFWSGWDNKHYKWNVW